ncbi:MAG TPA: hypothetical protein VNG04_03510, partial [Candidatus Acidoferrum sp.]|nr:hypothetical protein [Candidatus Acidoferrum sp.]
MDVSSKHAEGFGTHLDRGRSASAEAALAARLLGALALLTVGAVHLHEYDYLYSSIPTIGPLFLL